MFSMLANEIGDLTLPEISKIDLDEPLAELTFQEIEKHKIKKLLKELDKADTPIRQGLVKAKIIDVGEKAIHDRESAITSGDDINVSASTSGVDVYLEPRAGTLEPFMYLSKDDIKGYRKHEWLEKLGQIGDFPELDERIRGVIYEDFVENGVPRLLEEMERSKTPSKKSRLKARALDILRCSVQTRREQS